MSERYEVASVLAEGGQGRVYRASDRITSQKCVLKTGNSVRDEAILAIQLNHPYIAKPFDVGIDQSLGQYAAYPEYTETPLLQWSKNSNKANLQRVTLQIAEVLAFLHRRGWLYHDFKPEHFLVGSNSIRVLDLGLAQKINENSNTFSGTFPYIAPERLTGRRCDARSDIFGLGMLVLHVLLPDENWDFEPSIEVLQDLQKRTRKLPGFWKDLLNEMISLEPPQRIESAAELWKRLLPNNVRGSFLFFPIPAYIQLPENFLKNKSIVTFQTASNLNVSEIERITLRESWNQGIQTATFDLRHSTPEDVLRKLCWAHLNKQPGDFFSAIQSLRKATHFDRCTILLRYPEVLSSSQRALLTYALSSLHDVVSFRFVLIGNKQAIDVPPDSALHIEIPTITRQWVDEILSIVFPPNELVPFRLAKIRAQSYSLPEQLIAELRDQLPQEFPFAWPAATQITAPQEILENLRAIEIRMLVCTAVAAKPVSMNWIFQTLRLTDSEGLEFSENLQAKGLIQIKNGSLSLTIATNSVLKSLRTDRVRRIAEALLKRAPKETDSEVLYKIACLVGNKRISAFHSLLVARKFPKKSDVANEWYLKAFLLQAKLPKAYLYRLANFSLRTARHKKAKSLLHSIRHRFGMSYRLARSLLDLHWRIADFKSTANYAKEFAEFAKAKGSIIIAAYFRVFQAGALTMLNEYQHAEKILENLQTQIELSSNKNLKALYDHYLGLLSFFKGNFDDAIRLAKNSIATKHPMQATSFMNLGIFNLRMGCLNEGEKWLLKAAAIFQRKNDSERLSYAFNNIGVLYKKKGKLDDAREQYFKTLQLTRIYRNHALTLASLTNLSESYEIEGRINLALKYVIRAIRLARAVRNKRQIAFTLTQMGRLYGMLGKYKRSINCLSEAIKIRENLNAAGDLALSHELIGTTYLLSGHLRKAVSSYSIASEIFSKLPALFDLKRTQLLMSIGLNDLALAQQAAEGIPIESFEAGLYHYSIAAIRSTLGSRDDSEIQHLHEAERVFRNVPSLFWLGRVLKLKAEYYLQKDHLEKARIALESAYNIFSRLGARKEILELNSVYIDMKDHSNLLNRMAERLPFKVLLMVKEVLSERHAQRMIECILSTSIEFTDMERAALILLETPPRIFKSATLENNSVQEVLEISQSALEEAAESKKSYVRLDTLSDAYLKGKPSIVANRIRSILCLPLSSGERTIGVLYLDSKEGIETVAKTESVLLEIFANIISLVLEDAIELEESKNQNEILKRSIQQNAHFPEMIGNSKGITEVRKNILRLADDEHTVLIVGETGTGKELVARLLHNSSKRKEGLFIPINCASITETLLESELFGHEKGAFTGADSTKKGLFELAQNGTIFLDEIADLPYLVQAKLLRVLQEREFRRVGGNTLLYTNARVILASNKDLLQMVKEKKFREDLYYRVSGIQIHVPTLRSRKEDIALLANQFLKSSKTNSRLKLLGFTREAIHLMESFSWPGNVRQLKNEIERVSALCQNQWIEPQDFSKDIYDASHISDSQKETLKDIERRLILQRLNQFQWNIVHTSKSLGLTRHGLYNKMRTYNITRTQAAKKERSRR